eukprot:1044124-Ditylum_brightwellii.AAC.1
MWEAFVKDICDGTEVLMEYEEAMKLAEYKAGNIVVYVLESHWGLHLMHLGEMQVTGLNLEVNLTWGTIQT